MKEKNATENAQNNLFKAELKFRPKRITNIPRFILSLVIVVRVLDSFWGILGLLYLEVLPFLLIFDMSERVLAMNF
jgi:hypothetical protein